VSVQKVVTGLRELAEDGEEDTARSAISSFGPGAGAASGIFTELYAAVDAYPDLDLQLRVELKAMLREIEGEATRGEAAGGERIGRKLERVREMAPGLLDMFLKVLTDPKAGVSPALRQAAERLS
jgi:hypothetical protein